MLRDVFDVNAIVEMVTSAGAGRANIANHLATNHFFAFFDAQLSSTPNKTISGLKKSLIVVPIAIKNGL